MISIKMLEEHKQTFAPRQRGALPSGGRAGQQRPALVLHHPADLCREPFCGKACLWASVMAVHTQSVSAPFSSWQRTNPPASQFERYEQYWTVDTGPCWLFAFATKQVRKSLLCGFECLTKHMLSRCTPSGCWGVDVKRPNKGHKHHGREQSPMHSRRVPCYTSLHIQGNCCQCGIHITLSTKSCSATSKSFSRTTCKFCTKCSLTNFSIWHSSSASGRMPSSSAG